MAITKRNSSPPYSESLKQYGQDLEPHDYALPSWDDINFEEVEFIIDVDLDELDVFFEDKRKPYTVEELADDYSLLVDMFEDRVVGVIVNQFYSRQLQHYPELIPALRFATIIAGKATQESPGISFDNESKADRKSMTKQDAIAAITRMIGIE